MNTLGEDLIDKLDELRIELNRLSEFLNNSGVERTKGLKDAMGRDCSFYRRSLELFLERDYTSLRNLSNEVQELFKKVEGTDANK